MTLLDNFFVFSCISICIQYIDELFYYHLSFLWNDFEELGSSTIIYFFFFYKKPILCNLACTGLVFVQRFQQIARAVVEKMTTTRTEHVFSEKKFEKRVVVLNQKQYAEGLLSINDVTNIRRDKRICGKVMILQKPI